jgi:Bacterial low temperature requirement A protein (LtrA)
VADRDRPVYCPRFGSIAQAEDRFCGVCGERITPDAQGAGPPQEIPTQVLPPPQVVPARRSHSTLSLVAGFGALAVVVLAIVAIVALNLLGGKPGEPQQGQAKPPPATTTQQEKKAPGAAHSAHQQTTVDLSNDTSPPPDSTGPAESPSPTSETQLREAVEDYYWAVDREDWSYTYFHLPMIAGIIAVAAADELTVAHPGDRGTVSSVALTLGGTALFLVGHAFFKWAVFGMLTWSHVVAIAALAALMPVGFAIPTLVLSGAAGLIVVVLAVWDTLSHGGHVRWPGRSTT